MQPVREFLSPAQVVVGCGAAERTGDLCHRRGFKKALIVTDGTMVKLELLQRVEKSLGHNDVMFAVYSGVETEPVVEYVEEGLVVYWHEGCDFVLALGGGSALDTAKAIAAMVTNPGHIQDYKGAGKLQRRAVPLVALPTTAGTGSEVTIFTIITDRATGVKMLIASPYVMPDVAIVDPMLTLSCPPEVTAATGIDALVHAVEAYVSLKAQPTSDLFALAAVELIAAHLRRAWARGDDLEARERMMLGSLYAGHAFCNSSVALVHGMSRPIGANFHVPHGVSNAALLKTVLEYSLGGNPERYARIAQAMGEDVAACNMAHAALAVEAVGRLLDDIKIPPLAELVPDEERFMQLVPKMARDALDSGSPANNPRQATQQEVEGLYLRAYGR
jgi:alcohol dehydrogenase class IV